MAKNAYRVRNWKDYNNSLINRGRITFWIDENCAEKWYEDKSVVKKRGRTNKYSDTAIGIILTIKYVYRLNLRSCKGFIESILQMMNINLDVPCYTRVCRRQDQIELPKLPVMKEDIHMVLDSSGLKIFGEGEWKVRQHGWTKHRMWRKIHIGVDEKSQFIVSAILTGNGCGDDKKLPDLLNEYEGNIYQVSADGAYDSHTCYEVITSRNAKPTIPPQPNPKHKPKDKKNIKRPRDEIVWQVQQLGRKEWKIQSGYHRRSLAETAFYRYKQLLGDKLMARKFENQRTEALIKCHILNKMTTLGMPLSMAI